MRGGIRKRVPKSWLSNQQVPDLQGVVDVDFRITLESLELILSIPSLQAIYLGHFSQMKEKFLPEAIEARQNECKCAHQRRKFAKLKPQMEILPRYCQRRGQARTRDVQYERQMAHQTSTKNLIVIFTAIAHLLRLHILINTLHLGYLIFLITCCKISGKFQNHNANSLKSASFSGQ